ncbi:MAG: hypothetical protein RMH97_02735 [Verrucomicrobiales bacterium]|nr:hypothetical protein [Verrucomicrobiales bacterium]
MSRHVVCKVRPASVWLAAAVFVSVAVAGSVPPPEKLLPSDTLVMFTIPDVAAWKSVARQSPGYRFWYDPAMRPFREKFNTKLREQLIEQLERELGVKFADYTNLVQGQFTVAITQNGWKGRGEPKPAFVLLADVKDKTDQLKKNLAEARKKWSEHGRPVKTEKIRDTEFMVLLLGASDVPKTLRNFFGSEPRFEQLEGETEPPPAAQEGEAKKPESKSQLYIGQAGTLLIIGTSRGPIEQVLRNAAGGQAPALADHAVFKANRLAVFRDAHIYLWINTRAFVDVLVNELKSGAATRDEDESEQMFSRLDPTRMVSALGLPGLRAVAASYQETSEGAMAHLYLDVPEAGREGIFKVLAGVPKDCMPPAFVPSDIVKFSRSRLDAQKAWTTLEQMLNEIMPFGMFNFILESASAAAKETDPEFDLKKTVIANLGDDFISFSKVPRPADSAASREQRTLFLIGSPQPEQLVRGLRTLFSAMAQSSGGVTEREFLGKKIYSVRLPFLPGTDPAQARASKLNFAASSGYVALATDAAVLEEFLRGEGKGKSLRETPGLAEAAQKVAGPGTTMFEYENQSEQMRILFEALARGTESSGTGLAGSPLAFAELDSIKDWLDFSLLPPFEKVAKYFHFTVSALNTSVDGLWLKVFSPTPPQLKKAAE